MKYTIPLHIFFHYTRIMEKDLCRGLYTSLFCVIIPTLFPYFLRFWYPYILLHFKCFLLLVIHRFTPPTTHACVHLQRTLQVRGYHKRMGFCIAMKQSIFGNQCHAVVRSRSCYNYGPLDCARQCAMQPLAHTTVGLMVIDKGPLWSGSTCTGQK